VARPAIVLRHLCCFVPTALLPAAGLWQNVRDSMFSRRIPTSLAPNLLSRARAKLRSIPHDLTQSNPTLCGIDYATDLLAPLSSPAGLAYDPDAQGLPSAREAVAREISRSGRTVDPGAIVLCASTSEAYSLLFRLLCDPGDAVLVPVPSYPLFEHLAALDGVRALAYPLDPGTGYDPDPGGIESAGARALVLVHPNNPTGTYVSPRAASEIVERCARLGIALIVDEVFHGYPLPPATAAPSFAGAEEVLTFTLGGLSKHLGLPQLKLAWIAVSGPGPGVREALERLSFIADQYLSVGTPVQLALPRLFREGAAVREAIAARCLANLRALEAEIARAPWITLVRPQGGWSAVLRFPNVVEEEPLVLALLEEDGVAVHPGYFFDFPEDGHLALSLLPAPPVFVEGVRRVLERIGREVKA